MTEHRRAVGLLLTACVLFAASDSLSKFVGTFSPVTQTLWIRYAVQAAITSLLWVLWLRPKLGLGRRFFRTRHLRLHVLRAALLVTCTAMVFGGLRHVPVGEFTAISFLSPAIAMALSVWLLHEHVPPAQWFFGALAFAGAMIVIRPTGDSFGWAMLLPLGVACINALFQLVTRHLASANEHPVFSQWFLGCFGLLVATPPLLWQASWTWDLEMHQWLLLVLIGVIATTGQFILMRALSLDTAAALAPYTYVQIVFAMVGGWLLFAHTPDHWALAGTLVIGLSGCASGLLRARRTRPVAAARN